MGNYTEINIFVELETEDNAKRLETIAKDFNNFLSKRRSDKGNNEPFSVSVTSVCASGCEVEINLDSERELNAEWQADQMFEIVKDEFGKDLVSFSAEMNVPTNIIYFNREDEDDE